MMNGNKFKYNIVNNIVIAEPLPTVIPNQYGLGHELFTAMNKFGNQIAQIEPISGKSEIYSDLLLRCIRAAIELKNRGIGSGDIVLLCSNNNLDSCVPFIASFFVGAKFAALDPKCSLADSVHLLKKVKPRIIFHNAGAKELITNVLAECSLKSEVVKFGSQEFEEFVTEKDGETKFSPVKLSDNMETAMIFFSSGTTGLPKGIELSHYSLTFNATILKECGLDGSVTLIFASLYWNSTAILTLSCLFFGHARLVYNDFTPEQFWQAMVNYRVTTAFCVSPAGVRILKEKIPDGIHIKHKMDFILGGSPMTTENLVALRKLFPSCNVSLIYGQTEVGGAVTMFKTSHELSLMHRKGNTNGTPIPGLSYKVVDDKTGEALGPNQQGELFVKAKSIMNGYYNLDSSKEIDADGWMRTGDIVYYDDDLCFYVIDRIKEVIKYNGWHVVPVKLEGILLTHEHVKDVCVIAKKDNADGDHPMAVVVRNKGSDVTESMLMEFMEARVQDIERLRGGVQFVDSLPYTPSGKVNRNLLKKLIFNN